MSWKERITTIVTGKNKTERLQERAANQNIKLKQQAAYYKAKEEQAIRYSQAKAKFEANQRIAALSKPKQPYSSPVGNSFGFGAFGSSPTTKHKPIGASPRYDVMSGSWSSPIAKVKKRKKSRRYKGPRIIYLR